MVFSERGRLGGGDACMSNVSLLWEVAGVCARCQVSVRKGIWMISYGMIRLWLLRCQVMLWE